MNFVVKIFFGMFRGWFGEKKTALSMWFSLDDKTYRRFHDVIIPGKNGTTQIDHILISKYGLFIVETKNRNGWIFGSENQKNWTQSLYGTNYSFQNPLRQVYRQRKMLSDYLKLNESKIKEVIYFVGDCEFKTHMPENVIQSGLGRYIKQFQNSIISPEEIGRIESLIEKHVSESTLTTRDHVLSLRNRHGSTTICPRCGSSLIVRIAKRGEYTGKRFLGCEKYPKCRFTKDI